VEGMIDPQAVGEWRRSGASVSDRLRFAPRRAVQHETMRVVEEAVMDRHADSPPDRRPRLPRRMSSNPMRIGSMSWRFDITRGIGRAARHGHHADRPGVGRRRASGHA